MYKGKPFLRKVSCLSCRTLAEVVWHQKSQPRRLIDLGDRVRFVKVFTWICQSCYIYFQTRRLIDLRDGRPPCKAYAYSKTMALRLQPFLELFLLKQDHCGKNRQIGSTYVVLRHFIGGGETEFCFSLDDKCV